MESTYYCFRLTGRGQKTYMIDPDKARIAYKSNDSNVKIYLEADSSVNKNSREFDRVSGHFANKTRSFMRLKQCDFSSAVFGSCCHALHKLLA